ncbi:acyltransferase [Halobaculum gomorrense]|uniref:Transferase hexapeptide (Six repeat-containing protein) n=1 Tax=Halobaculum gomorrense TaxID=43928 RepID=A0A1M5RM88_9EURY|nr:acyltransferase [Halobaculum gomorrense]SHH27148.1 transferase hexapeptide (six repeat-containing protein) [Halobaculum gomorrense]
MTTDDEGGGGEADAGRDGSGPDGHPARYDRVERHPTPDRRNSLRYWTDAKSPLTVALNYLAVWLIRVSPSLRLKSWLLRRLGTTVGSGVSWGLEATPDVFWPERIALGDDVIVGYDSVLLCHEFLQDEYRLGDVVVGDRAMLGAKVTVLPGVHIGADAQVAANSLVADDVPPGTTVAGVPAEPIERDGEGGEDEDENEDGNEDEGDDDGGVN